MSCFAWHGRRGGCKQKRPTLGKGLTDHGRGVHPLGMDFTLTKTEWRILMALEAGTTIPQLAQDLGLHRTFAYDKVRSLIDKGLVARHEPEGITYRATVRVRVEPNT
jgi:DNA-binding MarR family transcriptional regulator